MSTEELDNVPLQLFEICLNREEYFPGEIISGKLLLVTSRSIKTEGIYVRFEGRGSVRWEKRASYLCGFQEAEFVNEKRKYFSNVFRYDLDVLPDGCSVLTFEFELPTGIPQSIEPGTVLKQLKIIYSVEAMVRTRTEDFRQQKYFAVKSILNLNTYPELAFPICKTVMEAVFESCWSSSGRVIALTFSTKKQGFVPGEKVKAELIIKDGYNTETPLLGQVEVYLIQEVDLTIRTASQVRRRILATSDLVHVSNINCDEKMKHGKSASSHQRKFDFSLKIPENILISYGNLDKQVHDFINIRYFIRMSMEQTSFPYKPIQINLPIKIGTAPIKEQKATAPILLLAPVPLALPRPKVPLENGCKRISSCKQIEKQGKDSIIDPSSGNVPPKISSVPHIYLNNSKNSLAISSEQLVSSSSNASPKTPKRKLGCGNAVVGDSCGSLYRPMEAFGVGKGGEDSDSESFRSGVEDLNQL